MATGKINKHTYTKFVTGQIVSCESSGANAYGVATLTYNGDTVRIDFVCRMWEASYTGNAWGISRALLDANVTPIQGGTLSYYKNGQLDSDRIGWGGTFEVDNSNYWRPARVYTSSGDIGGWQASVIGTGEFLVGTCFGKLT